MTYASVDDVAVRLGRELSPSESAQAAALLQDIEATILARVPDLLDRLLDGSLSAQVLIKIEANAVVRVLRNPGGYRSEAEGDYSYTVDTRAASGFLSLTAAEWSELSVLSGAFTITPYLNPNPILPNQYASSWE